MTVEGFWFAAQGQVVGPLYAALCCAGLHGALIGVRLELAAARFADPIPSEALAQERPEENLTIAMTTHCAERSTTGNRRS